MSPEINVEETSSSPSKDSNYFSIFKMSETRWLLIFSILVGALTGVGGFLFTRLIQFFTHLFFSQNSSFGSWKHLSVIFIPALGGLLVGPLVTYLAPEAKGHGVPEVMYAVARLKGKIRPVVALVKAIASSICIGSGGSAGKEGPIVQIGSGIGSSIAQVFKFSPEFTKVLVACGTAGGISATFGTPIAGVMFAMEVILNDFAARAFTMVVISSVTASVVAGASLGKHAFFNAPGYELVSSWELLFYAILGVLAAVVARLFVKVLYGLEDFFDKLSIPRPLKPALGGLALGLLGFFLPQIFGTGHEVTEAALWQKLSVVLLILLMFGKILATSLTLGSGGSGGVFSPSLFIGAMFGGSLGRFFNYLFPTITAGYGAYSMVGMAAVFAGATHAPITAILILFEMTGDYRIILPVMVATVISTLFASALSRETIYTIKLLRRGVDLAADQEAGVLTKYHVSDIMSFPVESIVESIPLSEMVEKLSSTRHSGFPVVNEKEDLVGIITHEEIYESIPFHEELGKVVRVLDVMRLSPTVAFPEERLDQAVQKLNQSGIDRLPVVLKENPKKLVGIFTHADILKAYRRLLGGPSLSSVKPLTK
jgi:CIC family chloride channel protein